MLTSTNKPKDIDEYIASFPKETQILLEKVRSTIRKSAPTAEEVISYSMPAFKLYGILVYFAGCKNHIGFYPTGSGTEVFKEEIAGFKSSKGAIQFPYDQPIPFELISKIVEFRVQQNLEKKAGKK